LLHFIDKLQMNALKLLKYSIITHQMGKLNPFKTGLNTSADIRKAQTLKSEMLLFNIRNVSRPTLVGFPFSRLKLIYGLVLGSTGEDGMGKDLESVDLESVDLKSVDLSILENWKKKESVSQ
jgi:hypothetical protein